MKKHELANQLREIERHMLLEAIEELKYVSDNHIIAEQNECNECGDPLLTPLQLKEAIAKATDSAHFINLVAKYNHLNSEEVQN